MRRSSGFTLIEVMMTVGITVTVFAMIGGVLHSVLQASEKIDIKLRSEKMGYGVLSTLRRDLTGVYGYALGAVPFKGEDKTEGGKPADIIHFVTTANVMAATDGRRPPPLVEVGYRFRAAEPGPGLALFRRAGPLEGDPTAGGGEYVEVCSGIGSMELEYLDPTSKEWKNDWASADALPAAVKVKLTLARTEEEERAAEQAEVELPPPTYEMIVGIPARAGPAPPAAQPAPPR